MERMMTVEQKGLVLDIGEKEQQEMLAYAAHALNSGFYPFTVETCENSLVIGWKWQDAEAFHMGEAPDAAKTFRYVVMLNNDGTFYGYDTDTDSLHRTGVSGQAVFDEYHFPKLSVWKKDGRYKDYAPDRMHNTVRKLFEQCGWEYREPVVKWVKAEGCAKTNLLAAGSVSLALSLTVLLLYELWVTAAIPVLFGLLGAITVWLLLAAMGIARAPVFSVKSCFRISICSLAVSLAVMFLFLY